MNLIYANLELNSGKEVETIVGGVIQGNLICLGELFNSIAKFDKFVTTFNVTVKIAFSGKYFYPNLISDYKQKFNLGSMRDIDNLINLLSNYNLDTQVKNRVDNTLLQMSLTSDSNLILQQFLTNTKLIFNDLIDGTYAYDFIKSNLLKGNPDIDLLYNERRKVSKISTKVYSLEQQFSNLTLQQYTVSDSLSILIPDINMFRDYSNALTEMKLKGDDNYTTALEYSINSVSDYFLDFVDRLKRVELRKLGIRQSASSSNYDSTDIEVIGNDENDHLPIFINEKPFYDALKSFIIEYITLFDKDNLNKDLTLKSFYNSDNGFISALQTLLEGYVSLGIYHNWGYIRNMSDEERVFVTSKQYSSDEDEEESNDVAYGITEKQYARQEEGKYLKIARMTESLGSNSSQNYMDRIRTFLFNNDCSTLALLEVIVKLFRWGNRKPRNIYLEWGDVTYSLRKSYLDILEMDMIFTGNSLNQELIDYTDDYQYNWIGFAVSEYTNDLMDLQAQLRPLTSVDKSLIEQVYNITIPDTLVNGIRFNSVVTGVLLEEYYKEDTDIKSRIIVVDLFNIHKFLEEHTVAGLHLDQNNNLEVFNYVDEELGISGPNFNNFSFIVTENVCHFYQRKVLQICKVFFDNTLYTKYPSLKTTDSQFNLTCLNLTNRLFQSNNLAMALTPPKDSQPDEVQAYIEKGVFMVNYLANCNNLQNISQSTTDNINFAGVYRSFIPRIDNKEDEVELRISLINDTFNKCKNLIFNNLTTSKPQLIETMKLAENVIFYLIVDKDKNIIYFNQELPDVETSPEHKVFTGAQAGYRLLVDKVTNYKVEGRQLQASKHCFTMINTILANYAKQLKTTESRKVIEFLTLKYKC